MAIIKKVSEKIRSIVSDESKTFARTPRKFALKDWKSALLETKKAVASKSINILAAGIAYFLTFAVFPAIAALVAILSFVISEDQLTSAVQSFEVFLPTDIANLIATQLEAALSNPSSSVLIIIFGILIAFISLSGAMGNVIKATNSIYEVEETRSFLVQRLVSVGFILAAGVVTVVIVLLLILNETYLLSIGLPYWVAWAILILRWVVLAAIMTIGLSAFYRYAPDRKNPHWQWVTWGSLIATVVWLVATTLFFIYARFFAHYTESYSVFAGILVLMIWLNLTAFAVLLGATINDKLEHQTRAKTSS